MPKKHKIVRSKVRGVVNPNELREATLKMDLAALAGTCRFLGQTVNNGETICYNNQVWLCDNGNFRPTGGSC